MPELLRSKGESLLSQGRARAAAAGRGSLPASARLARRTRCVVVPESALPTALSPPAARTGPHVMRRDLLRRFMTVFYPRILAIPFDLQAAKRRIDAVLVEIIGFYSMGRRPFSLPNHSPR